MRTEVDHRLRPQ